MIYAALRASMIYHCFAMDKKIRLVETSRIFWQGQEDSNPRPTVLETGTLPTELYPCIVKCIIPHIFSFCNRFLKNNKKFFAHCPLTTVHCPLFTDNCLLLLLTKNGRGQALPYADNPPSQEKTVHCPLSLFSASPKNVSFAAPHQNSTVHCPYFRLRRKT